jgi:hypothetical protein
MRFFDLGARIYEKVLGPVYFILGAFYHFEIVYSIAGLFVV